MSLTGNKDLDIELLLRLGDSDLINFYCVNKYFNKICESDTFWYKRLINKINVVKVDNFSKYKELENIEVTGERIKEMQKYFGLQSLKELNNFLNKLPKNSLYLVYFNFNNNDKIITRVYKIEENKIPKYINREELRFEMRRQISIKTYSPFFKSIHHQYYDFILHPLSTNIQDNYYNAYLKMEIIPKDLGKNFKKDLFNN
jgi:hypothetical protein